MISRYFSWFFFSLLGAGLGALLGGRLALILGLLLGGFVWLSLDAIRLGLVLRWLRAEQNPENPAQVSAPPRVGGIWGELVERAQRLIRNRAQNLSESQKRLDEFLGALQASPNGVMLLDAQGRIEWCNQTAAAHFGIDAQRDMLQYVANLVRDPAFSAYLASNQFDEGVLIPGGLNAQKSLRLSVNLHPYGQNRKLLLSRDITAVELAEGMRRDFVANVSHEIRTPLTVLAGFIETLQTLALTEQERKHYLQLMAQQSERMQMLVQDLLTLSRLDIGTPPGSTQWIAVSDLLDQCEQEARALSSVLMQPTHRVEFDRGPWCELSGEHSELLSAMSNLVSNALRYTPPEGLVHVSWTLHDDGSGEFSVQDQGPGIAPEHLPRLTERFYRVDRSRSRETGGTGLGLAIVKHVVQRHGAQLTITSQLGQGSKFSIVFPAVRVRSRNAD